MKRFIDNIQKTFGVSQQEVELLNNKLKVIHLSKNDFFLQEGEISNRIGFVESGALRQFYGASDKEFCNDFYFENSFVCSFASMLSNRPSEINIAAIEECEILVFSYVDVIQLFEQSRALKEFAIFILQEHLIKGERREAELLRVTPEDRFKGLMEMHPKIFKRVPLHFIASYLNITPETLSRYRAKLG
ncbi:Crp/Fnr family transcriptional regulator [Paracrocinitomix mangrovi]|uniref:Crp/Fnr family transcriptional regulator n=1 Tax=Paracrocinitomix mangrovi TaxID=2862509 RepID=UPI001C8E3D4D|nr:Crp/Fnr family transcriptional regulator [Paracrocinitomix mangrovi]UKN02263.1 Crp/Fnr family transcriptional regulator [Paracrocinitomix mangrovi]